MSIKRNNKLDEGGFSRDVRDFAYKDDLEAQGEIILGVTSPSLAEVGKVWKATAEGEASYQEESGGGSVSSAIVSSSGTYATLAELESAYPTGNENNYIVSATSSWYYWDSTQWAVGGAYPTTVIENGSIALENLKSPLSENISENLFNKNTALADSSFNFSTGAITSSVGTTISDLIPVSSDYRYYRTVNGQRAYYDSSEVFISASTFGTDFTPPSTCAYVRITMTNAQAETEMLCKPWVDLTTYQEPEIYVANELGELHDVAERTQSDNLLVFEDLEFNVRYSTTDGSLSSGDFAWTGKIDASPERRYRYRGGDTIGTNWVFYDASDNFLYSDVSTQSVKAPVNASYFRVKIANVSALQLAVISKGSNVYEDYVYPTEIRLNKTSVKGYYPSKWFGKSWFVMGDSISTGDGVSGAFATMPYHVEIGRERKIDVDVVAASGRTFSGTSASDVVMQVTNGTMPTTDNAPDLITIFAGTNDFGYNYPLGSITDVTTGTFYGGVNKAIIDIQTRFPKASLGIILPLPRSTNAQNAIPLYLEDYVNAIKASCLLYNVPYLDLFTQGGINFANSTVTTELSVSGDGLHPNNDGHKILKGRIGNFIESL